jgi:3-hydroxyacyl-[acyl-carrier-protein] dehydratase
MSDTLDIEDIRGLLPHRYPMLLVDRITEIEPGVRIVGIKNVTINEPFFDGHFPGKAIMPGVMILESLAQTAGIMLLALPENRKKLAYIAKIENARFRIPVVPGDTLVVSATMLKVRGSMGTVRLEASVDGKLAAECVMTFAMKERDPSGDIDVKLQKMTLVKVGGGKDDDRAR